MAITGPLAVVLSLWPGSKRAGSAALPCAWSTRRAAEPCRGNCTPSGHASQSPKRPGSTIRGPRYRIERRPTRVAGLSQGNRLHCTPSIPAAPAGRAASARPARRAENEPGREAGGKAMSRRAILTGPSSRLARARPTAQRLSSRSAPQRRLRRSRLAAPTVLSVAGVLLRREWNSRRDGQSQSEFIVPGVLVPFRMDTPLLGLKTGSARSAPPTGPSPPLTRGVHWGRPQRWRARRARKPA